MPLGSIANAYEVFKEHDFSRQHQFRIISMDGVPPYVISELLEKPTGMGGWLYWSAATIPGRIIEDMPVKYQGFEFHAPGIVKYPNPWTVTFRTPGDFLVRNALEQWSFETKNDETSCGSFQLPCPSSSIDIGLLDSKCRIVRQYRLVGIYPGKIGDISYTQDNVDVTTFTMDFHYQWWRPVPVSLEVLDDGTPPIVNGIYDNYHRQILTNKSNCSPIEALRSL